MVTGGLSRTDFGKKEVIGGIALEFYKRAGKKYGRDIEWMPEPRVAEAILNEMIQEAKTVTVLLNHRLKEKGGVKKQGTQVIEITMENGARFAGAIFADASYEGDLLAQAKVDFTWGRESFGAIRRIARRRPSRKTAITSLIFQFQHTTPTKSCCRKSRKGRAAKSARATARCRRTTTG